MDECAVECPSCAADTCGSEECYDEDTSQLSIGDWKCVCPPPMEGSAVGKRPKCTLQECTKTCSTCANTGSGNVCEQKNQACVEGNLEVENDWMCVCVPPMTGEHGKQGPATCKLDECLEHGSICVAAGQTCVDQDSVGKDNWKCECVEGETIGGERKAATCKINECDLYASVCEALKQTCVDEDDTLTGSWTCQCVKPLIGEVGQQQATECFLDECDAECPTCSNKDGAGDICALNSQTCYDPDPSPGSTGDWTCTCPDGTTAKAGPTVCNVGADECYDIVPGGAVTCDHNPTYTEEGCLCECNWKCTQGCDGSEGVPGGLDTECYLGCCNPDNDAKGPWCFVADVDYNRNKPACIDKLLLPDNRWGTCGDKPADGGIGVPSHGMPGANSQNNKCTDGDYVQRCRDPNPNVKGDWVCQCVDFYKGDDGQQQRASCNFDECTKFASLCATFGLNGQDCKDPNFDTPNDWECHCRLPFEGTPGVAQSGACEVDECKSTCDSCAVDPVIGNICESVGQVCLDEDKTNVNNWMCLCATPATGEKLMNIATCELDECNAACTSCADDGFGVNACYSVGQDCEDPDPSLTSTYDWSCICPAGYSGRQVGSAAACASDECEAGGENALACANAVGQGTQVCIDPDEVYAGDWMCVCESPYSGSTVAGPATCGYDECSDHAVTCSSVGQECVDTNHLSSGDWICKCIAPDTGADGQQMAGTCSKGDGCANNPTCDNAGQHCVSANNTWQCECVAPATGTPGIESVATCEYDECTLVCPTCQQKDSTDPLLCEPFGQECWDDDTSPTSLGDWGCECPQGQLGDWKNGAATTCILDECTADCSTCAGGDCKNAGQSCIDENNSSFSLYDWVCICPEPSGTRATAERAKCTVDECNLPAVQGQCTDAKQDCFDPDHSADNDWECRCRSPGIGSAVGGPAAHCDMINECTATCDGCATDPQFGVDVCMVNGQSCHDPNKSRDGDWYCQCEGLTTGISIGGPAECVLDECTTICPVCADTGGGSVCEKADQTCVDPITKMTNLSDWFCICKISGQWATAAPAVCEIDECITATSLSAVNDTGNNLCQFNGQVCNDPSISAEDFADWTCSCPPPATGYATAGIADCKIDECTQVHDCEDAQQLCVDLNTNALSLNDWICECQAPSTSSRSLGAVDVCETDECITNGVTCVTAKPSQRCVDPDTTQANDWYCVCNTPSSGQKVGGQAVCVMNECTASCLTCANTTCSAAGQECEDAVPSELSLRDWVCKCPPPSSQTALVNAAACTEDECVANGQVCHDQSQVCVDPSSGPGDWYCSCSAPLQGQAVAAAATCKQDECLKHSTVCTSAGQTCIDPNPSPGSPNDWECRCVAPATEMAVGGPASCATEGECSDPAISTVCTAAGQVCKDQDAGKANDWECHCVSSTGAPGHQAMAVCELNECSTTCATCANGVCSAASQECVDPNHDAQSTRDWECRCISPASGSAVAAEASCLLDECMTFASTCDIDGQSCVDVDDRQTGNWECHCVSPAKGKATAMVAPCEVDECEIHRKTCEDKGQLCSDPNVHLAGDWKCTCAAPEFGSMVAGVAKCGFDECAVYGLVCSNANQACSDDDPDVEGNWYCLCKDGSDKQLGTTAACMLDECTAAGPTTAVEVAGEPNTCEKQGQACNDPDPSYASLGDWVCSCPAPSQGDVAVAQVAVCHLDECLANVCGDGQTCVEGSYEMSSTDDWRCVCDPPSTSSMVGGSATCELDECRDHSTLCSDASQHCEDRDLFTMNTWYCVCPDRYNGLDQPSMLQGLAACENPPESECSNDAIRKICEDAGQACVDPDFSILNDWVCQCIPPATGDPQNRGKTACVLNECLEDCATCAKTTCSDAGQECIEDQFDIDALGDWFCVCPEPSEGHAQASAAKCTVDECAIRCDTCADTGSGNVCLKENQKCSDKNLDFRSLGDWFCICADPYEGEKARAAASCQYDECKDAMCAPNQACFDADKAFDALGDWTCTCVLPLQGAAKGKSATCIINECLTDAALHTCSQAGQTCVDPNTSPTFLEDWECRCPEGSSFAKGEVAECILDECADVCSTCADTGLGNICDKAGQTCTDPNHAPDSVNDWMCVCPDNTVTATANAAVCPLDECKQVSNYGAVTCNHMPRQTVTGCACKCGWDKNDWDSASTAASGPGFSSPCNSGCCNPDGQAFAWCVIEGGTGCSAGGIDRCTAPEDATENKCSEVNQLCVDHNPSAGSVGDWTCECVLPMTGTPGIAQQGICTHNECQTAANSKVCVDAGQKCVDPDVSQTNNWQCHCLAPSKGSATVTPATCEYAGECVANAYICEQVGQTCVDPDPNVEQDWVCTCVAPASGVAKRGGAATCILNECTKECPTCANTGTGNRCADAGQVCEEGSQDGESLSDWKCVCEAPRVGSKVGGVATCGVNECLLDNSIYTKICGSENQECKDPDETALGNWLCVCVAPNAGRATGKVASCTYDECLDASIQASCVKANQLCHDPNQNSLARNDWTCTCVTGTGDPEVGGPTVCVLEPASWCANNALICESAGQLCVEDASSSTGSCSCVPPLSGGDSIGGPADCQLDECTAVCPTCANGGNGNLCTEAGQQCVEGSISATSLRDWSCQCSDAGASMALTAVATCSINECEGAGKVCQPDQQCTDPDTSADSVGDWYCQCFTPSKGKATAAKAVCKYDECVVSEATCSNNGQTCFDPNTNVDSTNDWECRCISPATGRATAAAAPCKFAEECSDDAISSVCTSVGQTCHDPDAAVMGDWECRCVLPQSGTAGVGVKATCILDECASSCATCALKPGSTDNVCLSADQVCEDANTDPASTDDWSCKCQAPLQGSQVAGAATCAYDECSDANNAKVCGSKIDVVGNTIQSCQDPDKSKRNDWICTCNAPYEGAPGARAPTVCTLNECTMSRVVSTTATENGAAICGASGQTCTDPQQGADSLGNWLCKCADATGGSQIAGAVPNCAPLVSETNKLCQNHGAVCTANGQKCVELDFGTSDSGWFCECLPPATGRQLEAVAMCEVDECVTECATCAVVGGSNICTQKGQRCSDKNKNQDSLGDWVCECVTGKGSAQAAAATCVSDECTVPINKDVCVNVGQTCEDPDTDASSTGDWMCVCPAPSSASAVGAPATCELDECVTQSFACSVVGQSCIDANTDPASTGDWACHCPPPATGSAIAGPAECGYQGACKLPANRNVCIRAGQKCVPGQDDATFRCGCVAPAHGTPGDNKVGTCIIDECADLCPTCAKKASSKPNVCTAAGQTCRDESTSSLSLGDWYCDCPAPSSASALAQAASCQVDECISAAQDGAVQCENFKRYTVDGCECACPWTATQLSGQASGPGWDTPCKTGCCNPDNDVSGDWCFTADSAFNKQNGCPALQVGVCAAASEPAPSGAAAPTYPNICEAANMLCLDKDTSPTSTGDWVCQCLTSNQEYPLSTGLCEVDECDERAECIAAGQKCVDPDKSAESIGDWRCVCLVGYGDAEAKPATCDIDTPGDECSKHQETCANAMQYCFDPNPTVPGDWQCKCPPPTLGTPGEQGIAQCGLDECLVVCPTCAKTSADGENICSKNGQTCEDPKPTTDSPEDWVCKCNTPPFDEAVAAAATCVYDECAIANNANVCKAVGQTCSDPNKAPSSPGDWICSCKVGEEGSATAKAAVCVVDECVTEGHTCMNVGQQCHDPDKAPGSQGDWECICVGSGEKATRGPASCMDGNLCADNGATCTAADQFCQLSGDGTQWSCVCDSPFTGSQVGGIAECQLDECLKDEVASVCKQVDQECADDDKTAENNWECRCIAPLEGSAPGAAAQCGHDECAEHSFVCTSRGQACNDPNKLATSLNDWVCTCSSGETAVMKPADCATPCDLSGSICTEVGQTCNNEAGGFHCSCTLPMKGTPGKGEPASCNLDECAVAENSNTCEDAAQSCVDPDPSVSGDWRCSCGWPQSGSAKGEVAACEYDECVVEGDPCASGGQVCSDPDKSADSTGDWTCSCIGATTTPTVGGLATCEYAGACITNADVCTQHGLACVEEGNDFSCSCIPPYTGKGTSGDGPAECTFDECEVNSKVCSDVQQKCIDPDQSKHNDWVCSCAPPRVGSGVRAVAECVLCGELVDEVSCKGYAGECSWSDTHNMCEAGGVPEPPPDRNTSASADTDDDDGCPLCWLWILLAILLCCCFIVAGALLWRRRKRDEKYYAEVDDDEAGGQNVHFDQNGKEIDEKSLKSANEEARSDAPSSPRSLYKGDPNQDHNECLLLEEEMAQTEANTDDV
ncbi:hypothetical protein DIPPA_70101b [Diplonema papillatum]|nr:hypothetical protein DIPPA_70101b [Diplonema papillatum]